MIQPGCCLRSPLPVLCLVAFTLNIASLLGWSVRAQQLVQGGTVRGGPGWGREFPDEPGLLEYDLGPDIDVELYERYQRRRLADLAGWLATVQAKLRDKTLTVGVFPQRPELDSITAAFKGLGAKVNQYSKKKLPQDWTMRDDVLVVYAYSPRRYQERINAGKHTLVVELAYWRGKIAGTSYVSISWDGVNNRGLHPIGPEKRWAKLRHGLRVKAYSHDCRSMVLILGQVYDDRTQIPISRRHGDPNAFLQYVTDRLLQSSNIVVAFKAHPAEMAKKKGKYFRPKGAKDVSKQTFAQLLPKTYMAVTANSGAGIEALQNGVPVYAGDVGFMAWRCSIKSLDDLASLPLYQRDTCFNHIAYSQWSGNEIRGGKALEYLLGPQYFNVTVQLEKPRIESVRLCPEVAKTTLPDAELVRDQVAQKSPQ